MEHSTWSQKTVLFLAVSLGKPLGLSESQCSHLQNGASPSTNTSMVFSLAEVYEWWGELPFLKCIPCFGYLTYIISFCPQQNTVTETLEIAAWKVQQHGEWKSQDSNPNPLTPKPLLLPLSFTSRLMCGKGLWKLWRATYVITIVFVCGLNWMYALLLNPFFAHCQLEEKSLGKLSLPSGAPWKRTGMELAGALPACLPCGSAQLPCFRGEQSSCNWFSRPHRLGQGAKPSFSFSLSKCWNMFRQNPLISQQNPTFGGTRILLKIIYL